MVGGPNKKSNYFNGFLYDYLTMWYIDLDDVVRPNGSGGTKSGVQPTHSIAHRVQHPEA